MDIAETQLGNIRILRPSGRIDSATSTEFQATLLKAVADAADGVIVDFAKVEYISSAGFRALMTARRQSKDRFLAVAGLQPVIEEIFNIARFQHVVPIFASVDAAANAKGAQAKA